MTMPVMGATITKAYKEPPPSGFTYSKGYHTGIDLIGSKEIYATLDGTIIKVGWDPAGWGRYIILRTTAKNGNQYDIIHAHLSKTSVAEGQKVNAGDVLGIMGATGQVTGVHLHYEVRKVPWSAKNEIDPTAFLGIKNTRGAISKVSIDATTYIVYSNDIDERAALYLAEWLKGKTIPVSAVKDNMSNIPYTVGIDKKFTPTTKCIVGINRFDTARKVLELCQ